MKLITSFKALMQLAHELGQARKSGDINRIANAEKRHDEYKALCLKADAIFIEHLIF